MDDNYGHLAELYRGFCKDDFALMLESLDAGMRSIAPRLREPSLLAITPETALDVARLLLPDQGGSFRFGTLGRGRTENLEDEASSLFAQLVKNQRPEARQGHRKNKDVVWRFYRKALDLYGITPLLVEKDVITPSLPIHFKHTYENGSRHALQPLSLDYAKPSDITDQAAKWRGIGAELAETQGFGRLDLLLGRPERLTPGYSDEHETAYKQAVSLLKKITVSHRIVEEDEAADYAKDLAADMKAHHLLK